MNNIKGYAIANDGSAKRVAITYDTINDETGMPVKLNVKANLFILDDEILNHISIIEDFLQNKIDSM